MINHGYGSVCGEYPKGPKAFPKNELVKILNEIESFDHLCHSESSTLCEAWQLLHWIQDTVRGIISET